MKKANITFTISFLVISIGLIAVIYAKDLPKFFPFNKDATLKEWQEKIFKNKVLYTLESNVKEGYLMAKSDSACSGLFYRISFNIKDFPMMSWNWKVLKFPDKSTVNKSTGGWIEKDDYAGRVYVIFPGLFFSGTKSIEYIWDENLPAETVLTSPYFRNIKLIVAESGKARIGEWVFEKRNIYEDYKKAFRSEPLSRVGAIALMTDTDNTLSTAETLYKDIKVGYKNE
ncbi:MAG: DUF3047 domain-containing protein [Candidatus Omnitrophota bacterium]